MSPTTVQHMSECFIKPKFTPEESKQPYYLSPWDLSMLSVHYIQKGILFVKPQAHSMDSFLEILKNSLSAALVHFYPLAGRLSTIKNEDQCSCSVFVDCKNSTGAKFIYATLDMTISEILSPNDVPLVVQSFFDHDRGVNYDGHTLSLLSIQVTELLDGIFIGCSMNHAIGDGTAFWNFFNAWSEIFQKLDESNDGISIPISRPPILKRWFPSGHGPIMNLPFTNPDEFISRFEAPQLRERVFHFSTESIAKLKAKANTECNTNKISSFQSLSALVWRSITRARLQTGYLTPDKITSCRLATNNRLRIEPSLSQEYFGNFVQTLRGFTTAGELLEHGLGWSAWLLHQAVVDHNDKMVQDLIGAWLESPSVYQLGRFFDPYSVMMGSSPRFNMYGNEFGLGKGVALRSGYANKFDGKVSAYQGYEGTSVDLEVCLPPDSMSVLESDEEFMDAVSLPHYLQ